MAHKKGVGSSDNGRDSNAKYLGVKLFGGQYAKAGNIILRQRGTKYHLGDNVYMGRDHTVHAKVEGHVGFMKRRKGRTFVFIKPLQEGGSDVAAIKRIARNSGAVSPKVAAPKAAEPKAAAPKAAEPKAAAPKVAEPKAAAPKAAEPKAAAPKADEPKVAAPKAAEPKAAAPKAATAAPASSGKADKITKIEGIGPKIAEHLATAGIVSFSTLATTSVDKLKEILTNAGPRYKMHNPSTWPQQAQLAADGNWDALDKLQDELDGGRVVSNEDE